MVWHIAHAQSSQIIDLMATSVQLWMANLIIVLMLHGTMFYLPGTRITTSMSLILPVSTLLDCLTLFDCWFCIGADHSNLTGSQSNTSTASPPSTPRTPYRWPIVPSFHDWSFPSKIHDVFFRCLPLREASTNIAAQSQLSAAVHQRDIACRVTSFQSGTQVAHLIPEHEKAWFLSNSMSMWNDNTTLDSDNLLRDISNGVLLRSDIHIAFDDRKFVFFPKGSNGFVVHMLEPTPDIGQLYHNRPVRVPGCSVEFLYARFAWSIFPFLSGFVSKPGTSRLVVRLNTTTGERIIGVEFVLAIPRLRTESLTCDLG